MIKDKTSNRANLFVVGVAKSGSSWLHFFLDSHPEIFMSKQCELHYFGEKYPENLKWYQSNFPFEKELYQKNGINVEFIGHPIVERVDQYDFLSKEEFYTKFNIKKEKELLLIMPGSRIQEVKKIFPESLKAANRLAAKFNMQIVVACAENMDEKIFKDLGVLGSFKLIKGFNYDLMKFAKFGIIKSGTSTLEAGYFALPMVIVYRTSFFTYFIGRQLITLDRIGMVNIILDGEVIPELIQAEVNEKTIFSEAEKILSSEQDYILQKRKLENIKDKLGKIGASKNAAQLIIEQMNDA